MDIRVCADPAHDAAAYIVDRLTRTVVDDGAATVAVSGGSTAPPLFDAIRRVASGADDRPALAWEKVGVWQVDERIAPDGDDDRNAGQLSALPAIAHLMPVTDPDLDAAVADYASELPERFDVVHLGLGDDGHTASWAPLPHPDVRRALTSTDPVFTIGEFNGRRRMTLGVDVVNAAAVRVVLVVGASKAEAVARWVRGLDERHDRWIDETLPVAAVEPLDTVLFLDPAAAGSLDGESDVAQDGYGQG